MSKIAYSERQRDKLEDELSAAANKRELLERHGNGVRIIAYYLMKEQVCTIYIEDERIQQAVEFQIPNDQVMEQFQHPFAHPDAVFPIDKLESWDGA